MLPWIIVLVTVVTVYFLDRWENAYIQSVFDWVPAILLAYLIPALLSSLLEVDFAEADIHGYSKLYFIPLAILAVMSSLSFAQLKAIGWKPILIFVAGSCWIATFPFVLALGLSGTDFFTEVLEAQDFWKGIPPIVGSWIGGSTSQLVLKELVECPENIFLTILVLDNVLVNLWTILMFQVIKKSSLLNQKLNISDLMMPEPLPNQDTKGLHPLICLGIIIAGVFLTNFIFESFVAKILVLSGLGLLLSNLIKGWNIAFVLKLGGVLILLVMAVLGLKLSFSLIQFDWIFLSFLIGWLTSHFFLMLLVAKWLNVNVAWVPIASMANVGGIATAPAVTAAYEKKWMPHAIILAILSMATGTFWGMLTIFLFQYLVA